jgi:hypothetical protein
MKPRYTIVLVFSIVCHGLALCPHSTHAQSDDEVDYSRDVRPLLSRHCYVCHGPDPGTREAGLRLDRADGAFAVLDSGLIPIVPGAPDKSELMRRLTTQEIEERMPPVKSGHTLTEKELGTFQRWIASGAQWDNHWSFRAIEKSVPPEVTHVEWIRNPIDRFILATLEKRGIPVSPEASKATLIRRLSLDLTGLPPTPGEVEAFLRDESDEAYENLVARLLSSPRFGERWGRHWLDLAHYADSDGYLGDALRPNAWLYRDWVIDAINRDMSFDQFTLEQIAGDLLVNSTLSQKTATGFLRNTLRNTEAGVDLEEYRLKEIVDRVSTVGIGWLGLSVGCAECHSHKYDPISQKEFYELFAFFNDADDLDLPVTLADEQDRFESQKRTWEQEDKRLREAILQISSQHEEDEKFNAEEWFASVIVDSKKRSKEQKAILDQAKMHAQVQLRTACEAYEKHYVNRPKAPTTKVMTVGSRVTRRETFVHQRGDYRSRGEGVVPGTPAAFPTLKPRGNQADRLDLARWLVDRSNPLTSRVTANQMWAHLFGRGLVASVDNFGIGGELPTHPELLDWLASEFMEKGWSRKELLRLIVCSASYRQSASPREDLLEKDPLNSLVARQSRFRLEAETVRDVSLFASGLMEGRIGGSGIRPPQPAYVTSISRNAEWTVTTGGDLYRRGLYIVFRRATPYPMLLTFDAPDSTVACTRRERSNSPLQALTLLNDPVFFECAQALGRSLAASSGASITERLQDAFRRCLGREASMMELQRINQEFNANYARLQLSPDSAKSIVEHTDNRNLQQSSKASSTDVIEDATWVLMARILMNVDEFITRE